MPEKDQATSRSISIYPAEWDIVEGQAAERGTTYSGAIQQIIREWHQKHLMSERIFTLTQAYLLGQITEPEFRQEAMLALFKIGESAVAA